MATTDNKRFRSKCGNCRWVICTLLFFACVVNYLDRQVLGLLKPELSKTFRWMETDYGRMAITLQFTYAIGQMLAGPLINWLGTKCAYALSVVVWSFAAMSHALPAAAHQGWSDTMYTVISDSFPKRAVASVVGFGSSLAGFMSMVFVWLVSNILQGEGTYGTIMLICGSAHAVAWAIFHALVPQHKPVRIE